MQIGDNIRRYRKEKNMTQAQLAQMLDVSVQAVSKWETGAGLPDTTQLVPLSQALNISIDKLLMNTDRQKEYTRRWEYALRHYHGDLEKQLEVCTQILEEDPENTDFLFRASMIEMWMADDAPDEENRMMHLSRAVRYAEKRLKLRPDDEVCKEHLVPLYDALGLEDKALKMAYSCANESRALLWVLKGEALKKHHQKRIQRAFQDLLNEMDHAGYPQEVEALIRAAIPDGNYQHFIQFILRHRIDQFHAQVNAGQDDDAMATLRELLDLSKQADKTHADPRFTAPLFDQLTGYPSTEDMPYLIPHDVDMLFFNQGLLIPERLKTRQDYLRLMEEAEKFR